MARLRFIRNSIIGVLIVWILAVSAGGAILLVSMEGRTAVMTLLMLPAIRPDGGGYPLERITQPPLTDRITFSYLGGQGSATLVRPNDASRHGAVIVYTGIAETDEIRRLSIALGRAGVVVLLPEAAQPAQGVSYQNVELLVGAYRYLAQTLYVDPKRVGFAGFGIGSSMALIAAADPRISEEVPFVSFFDGYFSAQSLISAMTTHLIPAGESFGRWEPDKEAFRQLSQELLFGVTEADRRVLTQTTQGNGPDIVSSAPPDLTTLSPHGRVIYELLANRDPARVPELYEALPFATQARLNRLSPSTSLEWLKARMLVAYDRNNVFIPYTESLQLLDALAEYPRKRSTELTLSHQDAGLLSRSDGIQEVAKLFSHLYMVMLEVD